MDRRHHGHGISILVHERIDVVVDQCRNFETFAPDSAIMLHVSASADFDKAALRHALDKGNCRRTSINPVSLPTGWGSILAAHLANIRALEAVCAPDAMIALNASNDMMLRSLPASGERAGARFELREIGAGSIWYTGRRFARSPAFAALVQGLGCTKPVGSQIEGSSYPLAILLRLADRIEPLRHLFPDLPAIAEEVVFPTWGLQQIGEPPLRPFILFRASRLNGLAAGIVPRIVRGGRLTDIAQKAANRINERLFPADADPADIATIIAGQAITPAAWPNGWSDTRPIVFHGIKRIARRYDDPLRTRIRAHTDIARARQDSAA